MDWNLIVALVALGVSVLSGPLTFLVTVKVMESDLRRAKEDIAQLQSDQSHDNHHLTNQLNEMNQRLARIEGALGVKGD